MSKILFLDESGDHNLRAIDQQHPIFALGGVIVDRDYALGEMQESLNKFKIDLFGTTKIILHTADFTRQKNGFERIKEKEFCEKFYQKLNQLISDLKIVIVVCAVRKEQHMAKYGIDALDPYHLSLNVLVERFCFELNKSNEGGQIIAEARDPILDRQLDLAWLNLKISGTRFVSASKINEKISNLSLRKKEDSMAGLEIADAIVTPIARKILGRASKIDLGVIKQKMRKDIAGEVMEYGLVVLPKK